ncbi:hypothetical protein DAEQUDRAFT_440310 [Daedalea quercina L-15889]|uniref:Uncharacterized protein n=1 Tax=Daedalea quercina L-15889 TaxID=1314783 RepID=A0A165NBT7_9APHY|nr:hypothetical protein DAEQUDRAFT_440310 [Daedalea quercina L-15889]
MVSHGRFSLSITCPSNAKDPRNARRPVPRQWEHGTLALWSTVLSFSNYLNCDCDGRLAAHLIAWVWLATCSSRHIRREDATTRPKPLGS